jgi:signal transduction histidine kinase
MNSASAPGDCLACGIAVVDNRRILMLWNDEAGRILRFRAGWVPPLASEKLPPAVRDMAEEILATGQRLPRRWLEKARGETELPGDLWCGGAPVLLTGGERGAVLVLGDSVSARTAEGHLQRLNRLASAGTLAAGHAHEIKNALVAGKTFIDVLVERNQDAELAELVRRELRRIDLLVSHMLRFAGPAQPAFAPVRLHEVLDHALRLVQHRAQAKSITVHRAYAAPDDLVQGDDYQLEQAFLNVMLNAIDAMGSHGTLTIATNPVAAEVCGAGAPADNGEICVRIQDTGSGIPARHLRRMFEPFFSTKEEGTGLGLAVTRRIVRDHSGDIRVESQSERGATFTIILPTIPPAA